MKSYTNYFSFKEYFILLFISDVSPKELLLSEQVEEKGLIFFFHCTPLTNIFAYFLFELLDFPKIYYYPYLRSHDSLFSRRTIWR